MTELPHRSGVPHVPEPWLGSLCPACLHREHGALRCGSGRGQPEGFMGCECIYFPVKKVGAKGL